MVVDTKFITAEVMATAWYSKSGREDDDKTVALRDGSAHLVYKPESKQILTWNQRDGATPTIEDNLVGGYFVVTETHKVLVAPFGTFLSLSVVFNREPTEKKAFEIVIAEVKKSIASQTPPVATTGYAQVGSRENPAAWRQVKGSDGQFISVEFNPKRPTQLVSGGGQILGPSGRRP